MPDKITVVEFDGHWPDNLAPKYSLADVCTDEELLHYLRVYSSLYAHLELDRTEENNLEKELNNKQLNLFGSNGLELDQDQFNRPIELEEKVKPNNIFVRMRERVREYFD